MDLNNLPRPAPAAPSRLRAVRLSAPQTNLSDLPAPPVGEALPESQGFDEGHPMSDEEHDALIAEGWTADEILKGVYETDEELLPVRTGPNAMEQAMEDLRYAAEENARKAEAYAEAHFHTRYCPLPACDVGVRVAKGDDQGDVLGIGMSMRAAVELEQLLTTHLEEHTLGEWMAALQDLQEQVKKARTLSDGMHPFSITQKVEDIPVTGIIPGAKNRSPEKQAAVDAMDRRLGRPQTTSPEDAAARDSQLREMRRRRRAQEPTPYDLTPAWRVDLESGVVGIKR